VSSWEFSPSQTCCLPSAPRTLNNSGLSLSLSLALSLALALALALSLSLSHTPVAHTVQCESAQRSASPPPPPPPHTPWMDRPSYKQSTSPLPQLASWVVRVELKHILSSAHQLGCGEVHDGTRRAAALAPDAPALLPLHGSVQYVCVQGRALRESRESRRVL